ncbi:hypothetical protein [Streptomyces umbrinus]|uniref:hypothetical protein n=1 Tax=Streptomyces umbrinus TaxID=67370 RepID=UPI0027D86018|nr:hypothetical protein [Streptomyces umbrinus]
MPSTDRVPEGVVDAEALPSPVGDGVDINDLFTDEAEEDLANSGRENTRETYDSRFKAFANWCAQRGCRPGPRTTEANLVSYVSHLRRQSTGHDTIRLSIAAIVDMNARAGHEKWPPTAKALKIYPDARHEQREAGRTPGRHRSWTWSAAYRCSPPARTPWPACVTGCSATSATTAAAAARSWRGSGSPPSRM